MKKKTDGRITVKFPRTKAFLILFVVFMSVSISSWGIFYAMPRGSFENELSMILALVAFIAVVCGSMILVFYFIYKKFILDPIEKLSDAAKSVSDGDFSIRIAPTRKDGKKDAFEILFDDFNTMASELASTEMLKKDFVSNVSHELKTPISAIQNLSTMLQSDALSAAEQKEYAAKINESTKRLSYLVTNILQLSRLENQKIVVNKKSYNLSEQLCRCIIGFEQVWEEKNIEINTDFDQNLQFYSDEELLDIVWNNLISNALKFTPENGTVDISVKTENGSAVVVVEDTGCGMSEHDVKHIFDKFYQADTSHAVKGNGLGLALVKEIMNLVKGEISVESEPGKSSKFTVRLTSEALTTE